MLRLKIDYCSPAALVPYVRTLRKNDHAVERMVKQIQEFGFRVPVLIYGDDVVDGHLRIKAALHMGIPEVPIVRCDDWTQAQVKAFRLAVNRSATWAQWDWDAVAQCPCGANSVR
jgi:ParB-like chromosome segregation protein Spo0J